MRRTAPILIAAALMLALPAGASALPPLGGLTQLSGASGCLSFFNGVPDCGSSTNLGGPYSVAVSPDGKNTYMAGLNQQLVAYSRDSGGALTEIGCFDTVGSGSCGTVGALGFGYDIGVSPDGKNVYVIIDDKRAIVWFDRNSSSGALTYSGCLGAAGGGSGCPNLTAPFTEPSALAFPPNGQQVYAVGGNVGEVEVFTRAANGSLNSNPVCFRTGGGSGCAPASGIVNGNDITVSPDGNNVYVGAGNSSVATFSRDASGNLTQAAGTAGCISDGGAAPCATAHSLANVRAVAVSPDGQHVYATALGSNAVAILNRGGGGVLSQSAAPGGCVNATGSGCSAATGLEVAGSLALSPDGKSLYVGTGFSGDGVDNAIVAFDRNASSGGLTQLPLPYGCIKSAPAAPCSTGRQLDYISSLAVSPDGISLYATNYSLSSLSSFMRELPPVCTNPPLQTFRNDLGGDVPLPCTDPNGDPIVSRTITVKPARGAVTVNNDRARAAYVPTTHYYGPDSFKFVASDGGATSDEATASVNLIDKIGPFVSIAKRSLKLNRAGKVAVRLSCPAGEQDGCPNGKLTIVSSKKINITLHRQRKAKVSLGSSKFALKAGQSKRVSVKLTKTARRVVKKLKDVRVNLTATVRDTAGNTGRTTQATHIKR